MKKILGLFTLLLIIAFATVFAQNYLKTKSFLPLKSNSTVTINGHIFKVSAARSQKDKEIGLSETQSLPQDQGMIFLFEKPDYYSFWMKNMKFPIDIIYINNSDIVDIKNNFQPPAKQDDNPIMYTPSQVSDKVLEINSGLSEQYNFKKGDKVTITNL